jgi:methionyl-tRNA formyltransferase
MAGDSKTGMMVMKMDKGLDTGPVALTREVEISDTMTSGELHDRLMLIGAKAMAEAMNKLEHDELPLTAQPAEGVLYAAKIDKGETRIDFDKPAADVHNHIRGLSPFPGAWFEAEIAGRPERIKVLGSELADGSGAPGSVLTEDLVIACASGAVRLTKLQKAGGKLLASADFLRGTPIAQGTVLASERA